MTMRSNMRGVTLLELMVVVAVVSILGVISVNSYRGYMLRSNRSDAHMALLRLQAAQEKFFLQNNQYATSAQLVPGPPNGLGLSATSQNGYYNIILNRPNATTYTAQAVATGGQANDVAACRTLEIDHLGNRKPVGNECWR